MKKMLISEAKKEAMLILKDLDSRLKDFEIKSGMGAFVSITFKATDYSHPNKYSEDASFSIGQSLPRYSKEHIEILFGEKEKLRDDKEE